VAPGSRALQFQVGKHWLAAAQMHNEVWPKRSRQAGRQEAMSGLHIQHSTDKHLAPPQAADSVLCVISPLVYIYLHATTGKQQPMRRGPMDVTVSLNLRIKSLDQGPQYTSSPRRKVSYPITHPSTILC
jgi:hypothetical protein